MLKKLTLLGLVVIIAGCGSWFQISPEKRACYDVPPTTSYFCDHMAGFWEESNFIIRLSAAFLLEQNKLDAEKGIEVIDKLLTYLDGQSVTYSLFTEMVTKLAGPLTSVVLQEGLDIYLTIDEPIKEMDKTLAKNELIKLKLIFQSAL